MEDLTIQVKQDRRLSFELISLTLQNIDRRLELEDLANLNKEINGAIRVKGHR